MTPEAQAEILNRLPEVRWDRTAGDDGRGFRTVFGWVDRPGSIRSDFVVVTFDGEDVAMVTSSALHSEDFTARIFGDVGDHAPCVPVEVHYGPELLPRFVRRAPDLDPARLGQ
jgi:hypothetical protein